MEHLPEIYGRPPNLEGAVCEELLCQQHWYQNQLVDPFNVLFFRFNGIWYRLCFDCGVIFWRTVHATPAPFEAPEIHASYRLTDLGAELGICGQQLERYDTKALDGGAEIIFVFKHERQFAFRNVGDRTSIST